MTNFHMVSGLTLAYKRMCFAPAKRVELYRFLRALIRDGKPLDASLKVIGERSKGKDPLNAEIVAHCLACMSQGKEFGAGLRRFAPPSEAEIILAAEKRGDLAKGFEQSAYLAEKQNELRTKVRSAMIAPIINILALIGLMAMIGGTVAPQMLAVIDKKYLFPFQALMFDTGVFFIDWWWAVLLGIACFSGIIGATMPMFSHTGKVRSFLDKYVPPWSIYNAVTGAAFLAAASSMMSAGTPIGEAIAFMKNGARKNHYLRRAYEMMIERLKEGKPPGVALDVGFFGDKTATMLVVYANSSEFVSAMNTIGNETLSDTIKRVEQQFGILRFVLTVATGACVAWVVLSIMMLSQVFDKMKREQTAATEASPPAVVSVYTQSIPKIHSWRA